MVKIISDSTCDLSQEVLERYDRYYSASYCKRR